MADELKGNLDDYIKDCKELKRDLKQLISDIQFEQNGGIIRYAVDFSEIFYYVLPQSATKRNSLFWDDEAADVLTALNHLSLRRLFNPPPDRPLILLEPYGVELDHFTSNRLHQGFEHLIKLSIKIYKQAQDLRLDPETQKFLGTNSLEERDKGDLLTFVEQRYPRLLLSLDSIEKREEIFQRLEDLFDHKVFVPLSHFDVEVNVEIDDKLTRDWHEALLKKRQHLPDAYGTSYLDALAVTMLVKANEKLLSRHEKLHLIARSRAMLSVINDEDALRSNTGDIIRHSRLSNLLYRLRHQSKTELSHDLTTLLSSVEAVLLAAQALTDRGDYSQLPEIINSINNIKADWRKTYTLDSVMSEASFANSEQQKHPLSRSRATGQILTLLAQPNFKELITEELISLTYSLQSQQYTFGIGWQMLILNKQERELLLKNIATANTEEQPRVRATLQAMPYVLHFNSPDVRSQLGAFQSVREHTWEEIYEILRTHFRNQLIDESSLRNFEWWLGTALMLGILNRWPLAEIICNQALDIVKSNSDVPKQEGYFFNAICMRKAHPTAWRYHKGIGFIDRALSEKSKYDPIDPIDPRFLKEKGTLILLFHKDFPIDAGKSRYSVNDGINLLHQAIPKCIEGRDDNILIQIYNNLLFYYTGFQQIEDKQTLRFYREEILRLQSSLEPDESKWPPFILDTIAWSKWILEDEISESKKKTKIINRLKMALRSTELSHKEREEIQEHLKRVERGKK